MCSFEKRLFLFIDRCIDYISIILFVFIFIVVLIQICLRYIFNNPLVWSEEMARYAFIWICYLGWALGTRNRSHIQINFFINLFPKMLKKIMTTFNSLLLVIFSIYMTMYGFKMTSNSIALPAITVPITIGVVYLIVPITGLIIILYEIMYLKNSVWGRDKDL